MKCLDCDREINEKEIKERNYEFCPYCGTKLFRTSMVESKDITEPLNTYRDVKE